LETLLVSQPDCGETALEIVDQLIRSDSFDLVVVDSVAALTPRAELEGEIGAATIGLQARLMSSALRKVAANASRAGTTVLLVEQNAFLALQIANRGYVLETGRIVLSDAAASLSSNPKVKAAYLGG
jgi:energy-coupling factor transporter ATP-binding protein EcfA2